MSVVTRISPGSALKMGLVIYGLIGLAIGAFLTAASLLQLSLGNPEPPARGARSLGALAIVLVPIVYGALGGIMTAVAAAVYNLAARWVGGLQIETR